LLREGIPVSHVRAWLAKRGIDVSPSDASKGRAALLRSMGSSMQSDVASVASVGSLDTSSVADGSPLKSGSMVGGADIGARSFSDSSGMGPAGLLQKMEMSGKPGFITLSDLLTDNQPTLNAVIRALLDDLVMPQWGEFIDVFQTIVEHAQGHRDAHDLAGVADGGTGAMEEEEEPPSGTELLYARIREMVKTLPNDFGVAVCTTDGQVFESGTSRKKVPILDGVKPLLYALAVHELGVDLAGNWVASEPTAMDPEGFNLLNPEAGGHGSSGDKESRAADEEVAEEEEGGLPVGMRRSATQAIKEFEASPGPKTMGSASASGAAHPTSIIGLLQSKAPGAQIPYNPFMTTGALSLTAILSKLFRHGDSGSRFDSILSLMRRLAGGGKVGFNNPVFLNLKQDGLNAMALSHYMKGMQCYPQGTDPTDVANFYFQCMSLEMNARQLSVVAASLAAMGRCPLTGEQVLRPGILKPLLSVMYSCGLNQYSGKWQFHVGIPATASGSGTLMLIIPNVMGMVIYAPDMRGGDTVVSRRAEKLCELLVSRFRVNLFDHVRARGACRCVGCAPFRTCSAQSHTSKH
jgi:glutaminase